MWLFDRTGFTDSLRVSHVIFAIMWMGLLWFFNLVQTPAYAEMDAGARNQAFDKVTWRALWWFRWAAIFTVASGLLILLFGGFGETDAFSSDYWRSPSGMGMAAAVLLALIMLYNVWMVIWPNQQVVIGNARTVLAGGEADPAAAAAARKGAMASRQNTIFSVPVIFFMLGSPHFFRTVHFDFPPEAGVRVLFYVVVLVVAVLLEANALGYLGGTAPGGPRAIYDTHRNAIITGVALAVLLYLFFEVFARA
jgi:uncharacterized membrane protein